MNNSNGSQFGSDIIQKIFCNISRCYDDDDDNARDSLTMPLGDFCKTWIICQNVVCSLTNNGFS